MWWENETKHIMFMAYTLVNKCTKNCCKRTIIVQLIVEDSHMFLRYFVVLNLFYMTAVTGIGLGTIYGYVKEIMIIIIASQDGIVR